MSAFFFKSSDTKTNETNHCGSPRQINPIDLDFLIEQNQKIMDSLIEAKKQRESLFPKIPSFFEVVNELSRKKREIKPTYLYVIQFDDLIIKIGMSKSPIKRFKCHYKDSEKYGKKIIRQKLFKTKRLSENDLIEFCNQHGVPLRGTKEYFTDIDFYKIVEFIDNYTTPPEVRP